MLLGKKAVTFQLIVEILYLYWCELLKYQMSQMLIDSFYFMLILIFDFCFQPSRCRTVVVVRHFGLLYLIYIDKKKLPKPRSFGSFWRTERDSNPRYAINVYTSSSRAP